MREGEGGGNATVGGGNSTVTLDNVCFSYSSRFLLLLELFPSAQRTLSLFKLSTSLLFFPVTPIRKKDLSRRKHQET